RVAHVDAKHVIDSAAIQGLALDVHLPGAPEQIEIVDVETAEYRLQSIEDGGDIHAQRLHLLAVDVEVELRGVRGVRREHPAERRVLIGGEDQTARDGCNIGSSPAAQVLQLVLEAAARPQADDGGQVVCDDVGFADSPELAFELADQRLGG